MTVRKQTVLIIDADILVKLCQPDYYKAWMFKALFEDPWNKVVIPEIATKEWKLSKDKKFTEFHDQIINPLEKAKKISSTFRSLKERKNFEDSLNKLIKFRKREFYYTFGRKFEFIDYRINRDLVTQPQLTTRSKSIIADLALNKERPFFCSADLKNNDEKFEVKDAYGFFSAIDYAKSLRKNDENIDIYFITEKTENYSDFSNKSKLHENLAPYFEELNIQYSINLKGILLKLNPLIDSSEKDEMMQANKYLQDQYFIDCKNKDCDGEVHLKVDCYWGNFGFWFAECPKCKYEWRTNDRIEDDYN
ncbi:hypothetical protein [Paenibacillus chitinolyticus]|uniref:hypothetical protein n=1 Tax=Paenibacillus chitinolyticus TaxID=79263 RepID=UPI0036735180